MGDLTFDTEIILLKYDFGEYMTSETMDFYIVVLLLLL